MDFWLARLVCQRVDDKNTGGGKGRKKRLRISDFIIVLSCFIYFTGVEVIHLSVRRQTTKVVGRDAGFREAGGCNSLLMEAQCSVTRGMGPQLG